MNARIREIGGSVIREIAAKRKPTSIDLGLGEPSLLPNMQHLEKALEHVRERGLRYTVNAGDAALRRRIAEHYHYPQLSSAENVCITTGSQEATYAVLQTLLTPGKDELLIVEPAFPSYAKMATLQGATVRSVQMNEAENFAFDPERILAAVAPATRVIALCSPCNPTGRTISADAVAALAEGLQRRPGAPVWILHDEIYRELTYTGDAGYAAQRYAHTVVTNSLSKSNALTGLRLGWAMAPAAIAPHVVKVHAWLTSCADTFAQRVALEIFSTPDGLREHAAWYAQQRERVVETLRASGLRFIVPDGAFYACVKLPDEANSLVAAHVLADDYDVVAVPGVAFGACFAQWLRLTWVCSIEDFSEGLSRIGSFMTDRCTPTLSS